MAGWEPGPRGEQAAQSERRRAGGAPAPAQRPGARAEEAPGPQAARAAACGGRSPTKDHAAFVALGELDVRCAKFLTKRRNVQCTGEDYESISDIAKELAAANVRSLCSIY